MPTEFKLPELGEGVDSADVSRIRVSEGDEIDADQNVMELETEKAVADLPCPHAGKIAKIHVAEGDTIKVGQTLLTIEEVEAEETEDKSPSKDETGEEEAAAAEKEDTESEQQEKEETPQDQQAEENEEPDAEEAKSADEAADKAEADKAEQEPPESKDEDKKPAKEKEPSEKPSPEKRGGDGSPPPAGPATRRLARKLGVDLAELEPSDDGRRIKQEDIVRAYVESGKASSLAQKKLPDFEKLGPVERQPLNKIARTAAKRLSDSWRLIPHVTQHGLADITELEAARREFVAEADQSQPKITFTALAVKAVVGVLKQLPKFNASLDMENDELVLKHFFHIGIAVDTDHGLLVPVIRDADRRSLVEIAAEIEQLAAKARDRDLAQVELQEATFTISNQGGIGGGHFTPIVNWPEVAILGLGRAHTGLVLNDGAPREHLKLPLSLSYDHRAINGADAARFMSALEEAFSGTFELLIAS